MKSKILLLVLILLSPFAWCHKASDSFLNLTVGKNDISGRWDIALRDLEYALGLDEDNNGAITWQELRSHLHFIEKYVFSGFQVKNGADECVRKMQSLQVDYHTDGAYAVLNFDLHCSQAIDELNINYQLFFEIDPTHRGLLQISNANSSEFVVFSPDHQQINLTLGQSNPWQRLGQFITEGIWHIWAGYDHLLFLICLLLPSVVRKTSTGWEQKDYLINILWQVGKIVTAFTVAHSITLVLAVLQLVSLPSRLVESAIAFSVILVAVNNLYPFFRERAWFVAFAFGLIHGFGFASVLRSMDLTSGGIGIALFGFNLGVEVGQLAIVAIFLPVAYFLRSSWFYQRMILHAGSQLMMMMAVIWFLQRAFDLRIYQE